MKKNYEMIKIIENVIFIIGENMKKCRKLIFEIVIILLLVTLSQYTYSKYREGIKGNTELEIANWNIIVNDEEIYNKKQLEKNIIPTFLPNEYVEDGVIAPGSIAYYDININSETVNVSFDYILTVENNEDIPDIGLYGYTINPLQNDTIINSNKEITGEITPGTNNFTIRVYIKWHDDESSTMDNEADTNASHNIESISLKNNLSFIQKSEVTN